MPSLVFVGNNDADMLAYKSRILAAGGDISTTQLGAVNAFIATGKAAGWWSKIVDCCPFLGTNLATALVKLVAAPGTPNSYINHGILESWYHVGEGITITGGAGEYIGTTITPASLGLTVSNLSYGLGSITNITHGGSVTFGQDEADTGAVGANAGGPYGGFGNRGVGFGYNRSYSAVLSLGFEKANGCMDGIGTVNYTGPTYVGAGPLTYEFNIFRMTKYGSPVGAGVNNIGFFFIGSYMTPEEVRSIGVAIRQLHLSARGVIVSKREVCIGDSIAGGQGSGLGGWFEVLLADRIASGTPNYEAVNLSVWGSGMASNSNWYYRYEGTAAIPITTWYCMLGANSMGGIGAVPNPALLAEHKTLTVNMANTIKAQGTRVVICSVPFNNWGEGDNTNLLAWVDMQMAAAAEAGVIGVDVARPMIATGNPNALLIDYVHLNDAGATFVGNLIRDAVGPA